LAKKNQQEKIVIQAKSISVRTFAIFSFLIAFLFYGNSISNGFSLDDELVTTTDRKVHENVEKGIGGIIDIFRTNYALDGKQNYEYRPLVTLSFAIEWSLFFDNPNRVHISHFINVVLYAICGILLFQLLNVLFQGQHSYFSALVVALFLVHPIHSEVVNNLKNRDELLSLIFALIAAIQTFKYIDKGGIHHVFIGMIFITLSMMSKKSNLPFVVLIPLMIHYFRAVNWKKIGLVFFILAIAQLSFRLTKVSLLKVENLRQFNFVENPLYELGFFDRIPVFFYTNYAYVQKLFMPYPLGYYYGFNTIPMVGYTDWRFYLSAIFILALVGIAVYGFLKKSIYSFALFFFFLAIGGTANLITPMVGIFAERFVFSASIGFCMLVIWLIFKLSKTDLNSIPNLKIYASIGLIAIPSLFFTINRNKDWQSKKSLFLADSNYLINSAKANAIIGNEIQFEAYELKKEGIYRFEEMMQKVDSAITFYNRSLALYETYESNLNNKGALYFTFYFDYLEAISSFKKSTDFNNQYYEGFLNIGNAYSKMAEGFDNILNTIQNETNTTTQVPLEKLDSYYRQQKTYRTLGVLRQFEVNASAVLKSGLNDNSIILITKNASNFETIDPLLKKMNFSKTVSDYLNFKLSSKQNVDASLLFNLKNEIINQLKKETKINNEELFFAAQKLKKTYLDSAKIYFNKCYEVNPKYEHLYGSVNEISMIQKDYELLIDIQLKSLKHFKSKYNAPQYIQLANAYYSLGNQDKAKYFFKKGMNDLRNELENLLKKSDKTNEDELRINALQQEINRLRLYVQDMKNKKLID